MKKREEKKRSGLVGSAFALVGCYAVLCLFCFIMIVVNDPAGWTGYLLENYTDILTLAVCALTARGAYLLATRPARHPRRKPVLRVADKKGGLRAA